MNFTDTIAAIATPMGEGGVGIIRISGENAQSICLRLMRTKKGNHFQELEDRRVYYGLVTEPENGQPLDEALFFYAKKPRSYTAEDVIEIQAHGGMLILAKILKTVLGLGARMAEPGEFTMRAFMNGRIDLVQAESIIDLIRAKTDRSHELALVQLTGRTSHHLYQVEGDLYQILVAIEAILDYPEEGLPEVEKATLIEKAAECKSSLLKMADQIDEGRKIREGVNLVIVGRPNVGKSSLLNAFIQEERAIVTDIPGTTRDTIEAQFQLQGIPFILIDTAGLRETENKIEQIGIDKAEKTIATADLVLLVLDGSQPLTEEDRLVVTKVSNQNVLMIINKSDLPTQINPAELSIFCDCPLIKVSSLNREGFDQLESTIIDQVGLGNLQLDERPLLSRVRHQNALHKAITALNNFEIGLGQGLTEDFLAVDLRECLAALGEITGKEVGSEVLHRIFETFCIGK
ncbi:MAG TPA: tRNA uridine-5-carboxymethylaminomethyl(34) synthesis GTPase MnmE [Bacillota bacterium]|nr:tRNA uridine-5-carboxymethylaminomethyl(34) synthesis GTPase MnmE [Bacillota bacterium]